MDRGYGKSKKCRLIEEERNSSSQVLYCYSSLQAIHANCRERFFFYTFLRSCAARCADLPKLLWRNLPVLIRKEWGGFLALQESSSYKVKNAPQGCARICLEDVLRTKFGAAKRASTLGKCNVAERACTLCSFIERFNEALRKEKKQETVLFASESHG